MLEPLLNGFVEFFRATQKGRAALGTCSIRSAYDCPGTPYIQIVVWRVCVSVIEDNVGIRFVKSSSRRVAWKGTSRKSLALPTSFE